MTEESQSVPHALVLVNRVHALKEVLEILAYAEHSSAIHRIHQDLFDELKEACESQFGYGHGIESLEPLEAGTTPFSGALALVSQLCAITHVLYYERGGEDDPKA